MYQCVKCKCGGVLMGKAFYEVDENLLQSALALTSRIIIHICNKCNKKKIYKQ